MFLKAVKRKKAIGQRKLQILRLFFFSFNLSFTQTAQLSSSKQQAKCTIDHISITHPEASPSPMVPSLLHPRGHRCSVCN